MGPFAYAPLPYVLRILQMSATSPMAQLAPCRLTVLEQTLDALFFPPLGRPGYFFNHVSKQVQFLCTHEDNHMIDLYNSYQVACQCVLIAQFTPERLLLFCHSITLLPFCVLAIILEIKRKELVFDFFGAPKDTAIHFCIKNALIFVRIFNLNLSF